jgi:hypothetical protein
MNADTILWGTIALMTAHNSLLDIDVIHGAYSLGNMEKLNIIMHQFVGISALVGVFFQNYESIQAHMFIVGMIAVCWYYFDGCFMAQWQRNNITYTPDDFVRIQKPKERRFVEFLSLVVPLLVIDLYKLRGSL